MNRQQTILVAGLDVFCIDRGRQGDASLELSEVTLAPEAFAFLLLALLFAFATDRQRAVMQGDIDLLFFHAGQFDVHHEVVFLVVDIEGGRPTAKEAAVTRGPREVEETIHLIAQRGEAIERTPAGGLWVLITS